MTRYPRLDYSTLYRDTPRARHGDFWPTHKGRARARRRTRKGNKQ